MNRLAPVVYTLWLLLASCTSAVADSWIFQPSNFTHDPATGARVAQYVRKPPVEPLPDPRNVTSRYRRTRTNLRGTDGSLESVYEVQAWGNGRGGIDAEWERFHNAWQDSYLTGSYSQGSFRGGNPGYGRRGYGYPVPGFAPPIYQPGGPDYGYPGYGNPGYGRPYPGRPHHGGPHHGGPRHGGPRRGNGSVFDDDPRLE